MSQEYQQRLLESFFSAIPGVSQSTCQQVAAQLLSPQGGEPVKIEPAPLQGSISYTCMADVPCGGSSQTIIQFRREELNLESMRKAHATHVQHRPTHHRSGSEFPDAMNCEWSVHAGELLDLKMLGSFTFCFCKSVNS